MPEHRIPTDAPPSYDDATGPSSSSRPHATSISSRLSIPGSHDSKIPPEHRRSMEDERRPLPKGWVRTFDPQSHHQFFVDTTADPPRSIWTHPYDDEEYLRSLSSEERERIEQESMHRGYPPRTASSSSFHTPEELPPREGKKSLGRKLKDKVTGTTHEQRVQERRMRAEQEQRAYEQHRQMRQAMARAAETGQPQYVGKDPDGKDVYVEPPSYQGGYGGYGGGYGYNPYEGGVYTTPNARYIRPSNPYSRPYGGGYGGGYGMPLALGLGGGLLGGMLLGDMAFGGMGGGL
ncbi:hypothetical protein M433DRAFT_153283 [Acidomyces richmondensis BFW]|nr:MAG: hypothetical protein FE78DRAFT_88903 [Acidomyces sp. 'richmondensis']KYG46486.1 hypothetical protein M433DRAFT_153283 [Acidomyces richmondensis BFW]